MGNKVRVEKVSLNKLPPGVTGSGLKSGLGKFVSDGFALVDSNLAGVAEALKGHIGHTGEAVAGLADKVNMLLLTANELD